MNGPMKYRDEFPRDARSRIEVERLRAYASLSEDVADLEWWRRKVPFLKCVMRIFLACAREACAFAKSSKHLAWSDTELDQRCREFLHTTVVKAWHDKGQALGVQTMFQHDGWRYSIYDEDRREIEGLPEWQQYQALLLETLEFQSHAAI